MDKKRSLKKKLKKLISIVPVLIIIFSFISVPVFADTGSTDKWHGNTTFVSMPISQPTVSDNFAFIEVILQDSRTGAFSGGVYLISAFGTNVGSELPSIQTSVSSFSNNQ